jgi:vacuolar-type H+-ATPase subunit H
VSPRSLVPRPRLPAEIETEDENKDETMKEIIQELLEVEKQARQIVADAETAASQRLAAARAEAQKLADQRRLEATEEAHRLVAQAVQQAKDQKQTRLDEARTHNRVAARIPDDPARQAIEIVCRAVMGSPDAAPRR